MRFLLILAALPLFAQTPMIRRDAGSVKFTTAGSSTVYTGAMTPALAAYVDGMVLSVKFDEASGASPTLNIDGLGARKLYKSNGTSAPAQVGANELQATVYSLRYDASLDGGTGGFITDVGGGGGGGISVSTTSVLYPYGWFIRYVTYSLSASTAVCSRFIVPVQMSMTHILYIGEGVGTKQVSAAIYDSNGTLITSGDIAASSEIYGQRIPLTATLTGGVYVSCFVTDLAVPFGLVQGGDGFTDAGFAPLTQDVSFGLTTNPTDSGSTYTWPDPLPPISALSGSSGLRPFMVYLVRE